MNTIENPLNHVPFPSDPKAHGFDIHTPDVPSNWRTFHGPFGMKTFPSKKGDYLTDRITDEAVD